MTDLSEPIQRLIQLLQTQTEGGRRSWEKGSAETEFVFVHDAGSLVILSTDADGSEPFELRIIDPDGSVVERYASTDTGGQGLIGLYEAARKSSAQPSRVVQTLLAALEKSPVEELQEFYASAVAAVHGTPGDNEKARVIKPALVRRIADLRAHGQTSLKWPQIIEPFPSGGGVHNALTQAFRELRQTGEIAATVSPEPGPNQGFGGNKQIEI